MSYLVIPVIFVVFLIGAALGLAGSITNGTDTAHVLSESSAEPN